MQKAAVISWDEVENEMVEDFKTGKLPKSWLGEKARARQATAWRDHGVEKKGYMTFSEGVITPFDLS